jgi:hypothetical protein
MNGLGLNPDPYFPPKKHDDIKEIRGEWCKSTYVLVVARAIPAIAVVH